MKTLVILAHPNINESRANKRWKEELLKYPQEIEVHELYKEYPDWNIDVKREQELLIKYEHIIFQFPLYWFNCPPLLKKWLDEVFEYNWTYGSNGDKLKNKKIGLAVTAGGKREYYKYGGKNK
ncbi:NAD(P)H-dependent oxidoreductase [Leptotrichia massiliensis]|jgi:general stress protein 14